jgi:hypothetical protein
MVETKFYPQRYYMLILRPKGRRGRGKKQRGAGAGAAQGNEELYVVVFNMMNQI